MTPATIRRRAARAETVAALADAVVRTDTGGYEVPSATEADKLYHVDADGEMLTCDCQAGQHGRACKHVLAVGAFIALSRPAPAPMPAAADDDPVARYVARDKAAAAARGRQPWIVGVNEEA